jgi:putative ABC transport system permease protein
MIFQAKLALRYLGGRKLRTTLTLLAIMFGVMIILGFNGILPALQQAVQTNLSAAADQVDLTVSSASRGVFDESVTDTVRGVSGIAVVAPSLARPLNVPTSQALTTSDGTTITQFILRGMVPEQMQIQAISLSDGRFLQAGDQNSLLISNTLAQETGLGIGDTITLPAAAGTMEFTIIGITAGRPPLGSEELIVPLAAAQTLFNLPGQISTIEAKFSAGSDAVAIRQAVQDRLGSAYQLDSTDSGSEFATAMQAAVFVFNMFGIVAVTLGGFIIFITFRTVVVERRRDIGMLRAIGASRKTILSIILMESLVLGIIGTALGVVMGVLLANGILVGLQPVIESFLHTSIGGPSFAPLVIALAIGMGLGMTLLAGLMPAVSAMRVSPLEALRPSLADVERRSAGRSAIAGVVLVALSLLTLASGNVGLAALGILLFITGLALIGPLLIYPIARIFGRLLNLVFAREGQIAQGNVTRQPGRAAITASAITIGLALLVALGGLVSSLLGGMNGWIDKTLGSDYLFMPQSLVLGGGNIGAGPQLMEEIRATPGVAVATSLRQTTARVAGMDLQVIGIDPVTYPQVAGLIFSAGNEATVYKDLGNGRNIIVNGIFAAQAGVKLGDSLTLQTSQGPQNYQVVGIGGDFINYKLATGYISQANLAQDYNETTDLLILVDQTKTADPAKVQAALKTIARGYPAFNFYSLAEWQAEISKTLSAFNAMYILLAILAVPSLIALINTLAISVLERIREIGTLRAVGATRRQVRRMITAESLLLAAAGTSFGLLAGLWLGYILVGAMNLIGMIFPFSFSYTGILLAIAIGLGFGIIGAMIPARQAAQLDIVQALAYE